MCPPTTPPTPFAVQDNPDLGDDGLVALFMRGQLASNATIRRLDLERVPFGRRGAVAITDALCSNGCFIDVVSLVGLELLAHTTVNASAPRKAAHTAHRGVGGGRDRGGQHDIKLARVRREQIETAVSLLEGNELLRTKVRLR